MGTGKPFERPSEFYKVVLDNWEYMSKAIDYDKYMYVEIDGTYCLVERDRDANDI